MNSKRIPLTILAIAFLVISACTSDSNGLYESIDRTDVTPDRAIDRTDVTPDRASVHRTDVTPDRNKG